MGEAYLIAIYPLTMDGEVRRVTDARELTRLWRVHYEKHPEAKQYKNDENVAFLVFTPTWWRFMDHKTDPPMLFE